MSEPTGLNPAGEEPSYNIGMVTRMTGISIPTLRAWERRYNFPRAGRTAGGHRLYSNNDIMRLRWVKSQIDAGLQTGQAIRNLQIREAAGADSAPQLATPPARPPAERLSQAAFADRLLEALLRHDTEAADQILGEALPLYHPEGLILDVIGPVLAAIGESWSKKQINVATEHLATQHLRQHLLMWMISGPPPLAIPPTILACAPGEWHEGGLLMLGALLRRRRWPVVYIGQTVPLSDLALLVRDVQPAAVVLAAMTAETAASLVEWPLWLPEAAASGRPMVCFGGRIFSEQPEWRLRVAGTFLGETMRDGLETMDRLLQGYRTGS